MKHVLSKTLVLASVLAFSACDKGGGGGGGNSATQAVVPGAPQGAVYLQADNTSYCNFSGSAFSCAGKSPMTGAVCSTNSVSFTSIMDMCNQLTNLQSMNSFNSTNTINNGCNVTQISSQIYQSYCSNNNLLNQNGTNPSLGFDSKPRTIQCTVSTWRNSTNKGLQPLNLSYNFTGGGGTVTIIASRQNRWINLTNKPGIFGTTNLTFTPGGIGNSAADMITLTSTGWGPLATISQSGFAGQGVSIDAQTDDGDMSLNVSCAGTSGNFRRSSSSSNSGLYVCRGKSKVSGSSSEQVEVTIPTNGTLLGRDVQIATGVTATVDSSAGGRITFNTSGVGYTNLQTSAALNSLSKIVANDGLNKVDLTCGPR